LIQSIELIIAVLERERKSRESVIEFWCCDALNIPIDWPPMPIDWRPNPNEERVALIRAIPICYIKIEGIRQNRVSLVKQIRNWGKGTVNIML
jgi:hypothetical protein